MHPLLKCQCWNDEAVQQAMEMEFCYVMPCAEGSLLLVLVLVLVLVVVLLHPAGSWPDRKSVV